MSDTSEASFSRRRRKRKDPACGVDGRGSIIEGTQKIVTKMVCRQKKRKREEGVMSWLVSYSAQQNEGRTTAKCSSPKYKLPILASPVSNLTLLAMSCFGSTEAWPIFSCRKNTQKTRGKICRKRNEASILVFNDRGQEEYGCSS